MPRQFVQGRIAMKANKVLIPLEDSEFSLNVLPYVTRLLEPDKTEIYLLHVEPAPEAVTIDEHVVIFADQATASLQAESMATLQPFVRSLEQLGYHVTPLVAFGDPATEIERITEEEEIDLIAMATHGRTGIARLLRGSVSQHVTSHVDVPVLLYRVLLDENESASGK
jgi:nucleotide-binding universal stress UspA family protein